VISELSGLKVVFDAVRTHFARTGVPEIVRLCVEAEFTDPHHVIPHETRLVNRNVITQDLCPMLSALHYDDEDWFVTSSSYAIADREDHNAALLCAEIQKSVGFPSS